MKRTKENKSEPTGENAPPTNSPGLARLAVEPEELRLKRLAALLLRGDVGGPPAPCFLSLHRLTRRPEVAWARL